MATTENWRKKDTTECDEFIGENQCCQLHVKFFKIRNVNNILSNQRIKMRFWFSAMLKFYHFFLTQILCEINFGESRSITNAVFHHFRGSEFWTFGKFQPSKSGKIHKCQNWETLNLLKMAVFTLLEFPIMISRKIWIICRKLMKFLSHCVICVHFNLWQHWKFVKLRESLT